MLVLGILLTVAGTFVLVWMAKSYSEPFYNRPLIFNKGISVILINLLWVCLLGSGFYSLWFVNPVFVLIIIIGFIFLWIYGYYSNTHKYRAKRLLQIYKKLKLYHPLINEQDIVLETAKLYFQSLHWGNEKIDTTLKYITIKDNMNIKQLIREIFIILDENETLRELSNIELYMKRLAKKEAAIEWAYTKVLGEQYNVLERPSLSESSKKRLLDIGLNPDEMSAEQLAALESMEKIEKNHWSSKIFTFGAVLVGFTGLGYLIQLDIIMFIINGILSIVLLYIGYRIQQRISSNKFHEASIIKWSQTQHKEQKDIS